MKLCENSVKLFNPTCIIYIRVDTEKERKGERERWGMMIKVTEIWEKRVGR